MRGRLRDLPYKGFVLRELPDRTWSVVLDDQRVALGHTLADAQREADTILNSDKPPGKAVGD